jgi:FkbM family methyltransferase
MLKRRLLKIIQTAAFEIYSKADRLGMFKFTLVDHVFIKIYYFYKSKLENIDLQLISHYIVPNSHVIDVGANIGWFTLNLERFLKPGVSILAIEPDLINLRRLRWSVARSKIRNQVQVLPIALSNVKGVGSLVLDLKNPANHQISNESSSANDIQLERLDDICKDLVAVCLIKIDVQGHELKVLEGGKETILRFKPTILIEFDNTKGSEATLKIFEMLKDLNYKVFHPENQTISLSKEELSRKQGYFDCVCIPS